MSPNGNRRGAIGHVFRVDRTRGPIWYAKYRLPDGVRSRRRSGQRGPTGVDRPRAISLSARLTSGYAIGWTGPPRDAARNAIRRRHLCRGGRRVASVHRARSRAQAVDNQGLPVVLNAHLLPAFGDQKLESITVEDIESWRTDARRTVRTAPKNKLLSSSTGSFGVRNGCTDWTQPTRSC